MRSCLAEPAQKARCRFTRTVGRLAWLALLLAACTAGATASPPAKHGSQPVAPHTFLAATAFLTESTAWVSIYNYADGRSTLLKTDDAGRTWQQRLQIKGGAHWMRFFNVREAVVRVTTNPNPPLQTSIYRTLDGGSTWSASQAPPNPIPAPPQVDFPDVREGWLVQLPRAPGTPRVLLHTTDGGQNWNDVAHLDTAYEVGFRDPSTGWLARRPQSGSPALMVTRDGGLTWAIQVLTLPGGAVSGDAMTTPPRFINSRDAKLTLQILSPASDQPVRLLERYLYSSQDGGETWTDAGRLPLAKIGSTDYGTFTSFLDARRGWAGSSTSLFKTGDGGHTWTNVRTSLPRWGFYFAELAVLNERIAWGQLSDFSKREGHQPIFVLVRSTDGGVHWSEVKVPGLDG